jgi:small subunit ribosomal protein S6
MRRYESVIILDPDLPDDDIRAFTDRYTELIRSYGGDIIRVDDWGPKRLAYLVKKREKGRYVFFDYGGVPALIEEMERQLKISEEVIKFLSVKLDDDFDLEAFKAEAEAKAQEAARAKAAPVEAPAPESPPEEKPAEAAPGEAPAAETPAEEPKAESVPPETPAAETVETQAEEPKKEVVS